MDLVRKHEDMVRLFVQQAKAWAEANDERIRIAYGSDGGWELWLEVELFVWLRQRVPTLAVSRQAHGYAAGTSAQRADLLLDGRVVAELKAETSVEAAKAFADRVERDRAKVDRVDDQSDVDLSYDEGDAVPDESSSLDDAQDAATPAVVIAFAVTAESVQAVKARGDFITTTAGPLTILWELTS